MTKRLETKREHPPYFRFKAWLFENNVDLKTVAGLLNTTVSVISLKNNGYSDYTIAELNKLAVRLGIDLNLFKPKKPCSTFCSTKIIKPQKQISDYKKK